MTSTATGIMSDMPTTWREKFDVYHAKVNYLPLGLLVIYFVNAWVQTFPMIANSAWLLELGMAQDTLSNYEAFTFIPWSLKPIYAYIMDYLPIKGYHRRPWVTITCFAAGSLYLINGYFVRSTRLAFGTVFIQQFFWAFNELVCGAVLMDYAHRDMKNAGNLQSLATASRSLGSLVATLLQLAVYSCSRDHHRLSFETVLLITGLVCIACGALFPLIPEPSESKKLQVVEKRNRESQHDILKVTGLVFVMELVLVWITLKSFFDKNVFWPVLATVSTVAVGSAIFLASNASIDLKEIYSAFKKFAPSIATAVFLFLINITPSALGSVYFFQYEMFPAQCDLVHLSLISYGSTLLASLCYGPLANAQRVRWVLPAMGLLAGLTGMLTIPFVKTDIPPMASAPISMTPSAPQICVDFMGGCYDPLHYRMVTTAIMAFTSQLVLVPKEVIATEMTIPEKRLLSYSIFLSVMDTGASVRGWITAPIVSHFNISYMDWSNLYKLVWISLGTSTFMTLLTPLFIWWSPKDKNSEEEDEEETPFVNKCKDEEYN